MYEDIIKLHLGHALMNGHTPQKLSLSQIQEYRLQQQIKEAIHGDLTLGFFDSGAPNMITYYPDVTPEDLKPKDSDFILPLVRALSQVVVHKTYNPVDFSRGNTLKDSLGLLVGQAIYVNHECVAGTELGVVKETAWENGYTHQGVKIPAGINARLMIDGKSNPRIARNMTMEPPAIHSVSVSVKFLWEPSHKDIPIEEFYNKLGTYDDKGEMYTRIATKILSYSEISLVPHGADPFAQIIKDGKINNPLYAATVNNSASGVSNTYLKLGVFDFISEISNSNNPPTKETIPILPININNSHMKEILLLLAAHLNITHDGMDESALAEKLKPLVPAVLSSITELTEKLTSKETEVTTLSAKVTELTSTQRTGAEQEALTTLAKHKEVVVKNLKAAAKLLNNNQEDATIVELVETANLSSLEVMLNLYQKNLEEKMPLTCTKCHSTEVSRASAVLNNPEGDKEETSLDKKKRQRITSSVKNMHG